MYYIFLDESGDLGSDFKKKKTSRFFVISFLMTENKNSIEKIVKKIYRTIPEKQKRKQKGVLHCCKAHPSLRKRILQNLCASDVDIVVAYLDKRAISTELFLKKHELYCALINAMIGKVWEIKLMIPQKSVSIIASRRETNAYLNRAFKNTIKELHPEKCDRISVEIKVPHEEKCLQLIDFVTWSVFRKIEHNDDGYYRIIEDRICEIIMLK